MNYPNMRSSFDAFLQEKYLEVKAIKPERFIPELNEEAVMQIVERD